MKKIVKYLLYILPLILCFSYYPLIKLGENETMYFELSLPLLWLVAFDVTAFILLVREKRREVFRKILGGIQWWLFPAFVLISSFWSLNPVRGVLTSGLLWLLMLAVSEVYLLREYLTPDFFKVFLRWFFGAAVFVCLWCVLQCVLDISGVPQGKTLMCDGCTYKMFGFPHPNGFSIEPQFMGNLLLAPILTISWIILENNHNSTSRTRVARARRPFGSSASQGAVCYRARALFLGRDLRTVLEVLLMIVFCSTLFLTFSRGAIYACTVGLLCLCAFMIFRKKCKILDAMKIFGIFLVSFVFTLNLQGILAASSPTTDTYFDGVAKVVNHLSLGVIDIRGTGTPEKSEAPASGNEAVENSEITEGNNEKSETGVVENSGETSTEAVFDGYVAESTDTRVRLASSALSVWRKDLKTILFGVGIGGAGQALYDNGFSPAPREIVQNEYASLLLETGLIGVSLFVLLIVLIIRAVMKTKTAGLMISLIFAYAVSLLFFSGLPNALQIILLPGVLIYLPLPLRRAHR